MRHFALLGLLALLPLSVAAAENAVTVTPVISSARTVTGQEIRIPANPEVQVSLYEIAPGASLPVHKHPYPRYAYVLAGEITVIFPDLGKTQVSKAGDFIVEGEDQWHYGVNRGTVPVKLLVIDQVPPGKTNVVLKAPASGN